jgi:hypothetical protein
MDLTNALARRRLELASPASRLPRMSASRTRAVAVLDVTRRLHILVKAG